MERSNQRDKYNGGHDNINHNNNNIEDRFEMLQYEDNTISYY